MAKYSRKRQYKGNMEWIPFSAELPLLTTADNIVVSASILGNMTRQFRVISVKANWTMMEHTAGQGPIVVGYAHGDYGTTEIAEATAVTLVNTGDKINREHANRLVRKVGSFRGLNTDEELVGNLGGEFIKTRLNWLIEIGFDLKIWAQNRANESLTTGSIVRVDGEIYGKWD